MNGLMIHLITNTGQRFAAIGSVLIAAIVTMIKSRRFTMTTFNPPPIRQSNMTNLFRDYDGDTWVCLQSIAHESTLCGTSLDNEDYGFIETKISINCSRCIDEINNCRAATVLAEYSCADGC